MSTTSTTTTMATLRRKLRNRRQYGSFRRAYDQASPSMQSELLAMSQMQTPWR